MTQYGVGPNTIESAAASGEPVLERIAQNLLEALKTVTVSMGDSGDLDVVRPNPVLPAQLKSYRATLTQEDPELDEEGDCPQGLLQWWGNFAVIVDVVLPEDVQTPIDTVLNRVCADIQRAFRTDPLRGDLALDTKIKAPEFAPIEPAARSGTVVVRCRVWYRTLEDDPYRIPGE